MLIPCNVKLCEALQLVQVVSSLAVCVPSPANREKPPEVADPLWRVPSNPTWTAKLPDVDHVNTISETKLNDLSTLFEGRKENRGMRAYSTDHWFPLRTLLNQPLDSLHWITTMNCQSVRSSLAYIGIVAKRHWSKPMYYYYSLFSTGPWCHIPL